MFGEEGARSKEGKGLFSPKIDLKSRGGRKGGQTQQGVNNAPNQVPGVPNPQVDGHDQIVQSGNYCYSSFRAASMDENKTPSSKDVHDSYSIHLSK